MQVQTAGTRGGRELHAGDTQIMGVLKMVNLSNSMLTTHFPDKANAVLCNLKKIWTLPEQLQWDWRYRTWHPRS